MKRNGYELAHCVFIDVSRFNINMRPASAWFVVGTSAVIATPTMKSTSHSMLSVISVLRVFQIDLRVPVIPKWHKMEGDSKRNPAQSKSQDSKGITTDYYLKFTIKNLDEV